MVPAKLALHLHQVVRGWLEGGGGWQSNLQARRQSVRAAAWRGVDEWWAVAVLMGRRGAGPGANDGRVRPLRFYMRNDLAPRRVSSAQSEHPLA